MTGWLEKAIPLYGLEPGAEALLSGLIPNRASPGAVLFHPGDAAKGFVLVLSGRVGVYLTGPSGREVLLYSVTPGETCVQTTLGLLGDQDYSGEGVAECEVEFVLVPKALFMRLLDESKTFRTFVFRALADRLQGVMASLERVVFVKIEARLAQALLERANGEGVVTQTHSQLAVAIGSVREVVSRRLERFARQGLISLERGRVQILDGARLRELVGQA